MIMRVIELFYSTISRGRNVLSQRFYAYLIAILAEFQSRVIMQISYHTSLLSPPTSRLSTGIPRPTLSILEPLDDESSESSDSPSPPQMRHSLPSSPNMEEMLQFLLNETSEVMYTPLEDHYP